MRRRMTVQMLLSLIAAGSLVTAQAAGPAIGVAVAKGNFRIDNSTVSRNGTLFEGTTIETGKASSELQLQSGARIELAPESRGKVYRDHLILEKGQGLLASNADYRLEAGKLCVLPAVPSATARVALNGAKRVQVAALSGAVRVTNGAGIVVANIPTGRALEFEPQAAGAAAPTVMTGTLEKRDGHFILTDQTAGVTAELQGPGLDEEVGNCVEITGAMVPAAQPVAGATQLIRVSQLKRCTKAAAAGAAGAAAAGAKAAAGMTVAAKAVIVGIVVAGAAAGAAVALTRGEEKPKPPLSP